MSMEFNGSTYLNGVDLSGAPTYSSKQLIVHGWFKSGDASPSQGYILRMSGPGNGGVGNLIIRQESNGRLIFGASVAGGTAINANLDTVSTYLPVDGWISFDWVIDTNTGKEFNKVYINLVQKDSDTPTADAIIDLDGAGWVLGARVGGAAKITGSLDQIYISNEFTSDYVSSTGELTAKYIAEMYVLDPNGVPDRKTESLAAAAGLPFTLLENRDYSTFTENSGSTATDWTLGGGDLLPAIDGHVGGWTYTAPT